MVSREDVRRMVLVLRTCWDLDLSPLQTGEFGVRSGEPLLSGDSLCFATSFASTEPFAPGFDNSCVGLGGLEQRVVVCPVLLPTEKEERDRVGLC